MILPSVIVQPMARDKSANKSLSYSLISSQIEESAGPMDRVANSALLDHKKLKRARGVYLIFDGWEEMFCRYIMLVEIQGKDKSGRYRTGVRGAMGHLWILSTVDILTNMGVK